MTKSFLRREEHRKLSTLTIHGRILDVGGDPRSGYQELIRGTHEFVTANADPSVEPNLIFNAEEPWPLEDRSFDGVLFVNVLEHLYKYQGAVEEAARVLKKNGVVAGVVPFMFPVHESPNDYFRYTKSTLVRVFEEAGFSNIAVSELGTGAFSVLYHTLISFVRWQWLANILIPLCASLDRVLRWIKPDNKMNAVSMPLGYYFIATKS